eukprot:COSAG02_NODE_1849_length_10679_cov_7.150945_1_plen_54_part_00
MVQQSVLEFRTWVLSASAFSVAHMLDHMDQTLLEGILRLAPSVCHLERIGLAC